MEGLCSFLEVRYRPARRRSDGPRLCSGSEESTLGPAGPLSREQLGPDARGWGPHGARAALRGSHRRLSRAVPWFGAHGVDSAGLPGGWSTTGLGVLCFRVSVLRPGLGPGSLKAPQGREAGTVSTGVHLGGTRRGDRRRPGAGLRRRSWGERARGRREGAAGSWDPWSTPTPDPRAARSVLCLTQCGLVLAR